MKAQKMIADIVQFLDEVKEVYVYIYTRDEEGNVISTERIPLNCVFGHYTNKIKLCCEKSEAEQR